MNTTPPPTEPGDAPNGSGTSAGTATDDGPRVTRDEVRDLSRLRRSVHDRKVAGVAGGLARHLDIDPLILRVGFVVLAFFGGAGIIVYAACWALLPEEDRERAPLHLDERSRTIALVAIGVIAALALLGDSWGGDWFPWPLLIIGAIVFWFLSRSRDKRIAQNPAYPAYPAYPAQEGVDGEPPTTPYYTPAYVAPPRDPRKRGPKLFWFTVLLVLVAEGFLGILDGAGVPIVDSAYAALAVGVIATMLIIGSVIGRAGGLIALGLVAALGLAASTAADRWDGERFEYVPGSAQEVDDTYSMDSGSMLLDLTQVEDPAELDGRTLELRGNVGEIVVRVPEDMNVEADVEISGPGGYDLFDNQFTGGGFSTDTTWTRRTVADDPTITLLTDLDVGQVTVEVE